MTYTPINWQTGDTITADKLNKMDNGWGFESMQFFSETVTTVVGKYGNEGTLNYSGSLPELITVMFDGVAYLCSRASYPVYGDEYGEWDVYPFSIQFADSAWHLFTLDEGTYTIAASVQETNVSERFIDAVVKSATLEVVPGETTWQEAHDALSAGKYVYVKSTDSNATAILLVMRADVSDFSITCLEIVSNMASAPSITHWSADSADGALGT